MNDEGLSLQKDIKVVVIIKVPSQANIFDTNLSLIQFPDIRSLPG